MITYNNPLKKLTILFLFILAVLLNLLIPKVNCQAQQLTTDSSQFLTENIIIGLFTFTYIPAQLRYDARIFFEKIDLANYQSLLYVRNITQYHGQPIPANKLNDSLKFISGAINIAQIPVKTDDLWGYNFTMRRSIEGKFLNITLQIGQGVRFKQFTVGYLLSRDPEFIVGMYDHLYEKCPFMCPIKRSWPISMIIASPPQGSIFIPLISTLKVHGPQPSFKFKNIDTDMLNSTHRILYLQIDLQSIHTIEDITFAYIAHAQSQANRYALKIKHGFDTNTNERGIYYALIQLNGIIDVLLKDEPNFFQFIGLSITSRFFIQANSA